MSQFVTSAIAAAFRAHGIATREAQSCVNVGDLQIRAFTRMGPRHSSSVTIQLDVVTEAPGLGPASPIVDSFAGVGSTELDAEKNAFGKFLLGSFHVLAEALSPHQCDSEQVEWERWKSQQLAWRVCSGPLLTYATRECRTKGQYADVWQRIQQQFQSDAQHGPHWGRVFVGFLNGDLIGCEALLNGREWAEGAKILREAPWAASADYESLRHFFIALPVTADGQGF
jgi:hypothetical protein